ncbi:RagB/SusD family nutrient uptake outer membrane protein [Chitinophaga sp. YIM B06452]|uniref:RagB/SusD family nutrient uptake outer membrane protein n=1 Tax=Chitinophaga sp. YIM B06452 TaxID=3082158 RepID=UPI0031FE7F07
MKTIIKNCIALALTAGLLQGCDKFLDERPSKTSSLVVTTTSQLNALLNDYEQFYAENNNTATLSTDDYGLTTSIYNARPGIFSPITVQYNTWDTAYLMDDPGQSFWSSEYRKIFTANMVLQYADRVTGSDEDKANLKADAHFIRAYSYFQLANTFTLPYSGGKGEELGLPLKLTIAFDEPVARAPLSKVYEQIEADLAEAMKVKMPLMQNGRARHWRANTAAVNGFAARYYLAVNKYIDALKYANQALQEYSTLVDYNTQMRYGRDQVLTINPGPNAQAVTLKYPYTHDNQEDFTDMIGWPEFLYFRMLNYGTWWYMPSAGLMNLYDQAHDLRYQYHYVEGYSYDRGIINPAYNYPGYVFFYKDRIPSGPTTAEMLLIKAEAQARTGDFGGAMTTLNSLRAKRMTPGPWVNLTATGKDDAVKKVLEERRREMPFVHRWYDVRRYNNNDDPNDDVEMSKTFYPYTLSSVLSTQPVKTYSLPKHSRRFAAPLPRTEIISSNGAIQQNTY